MSKQTAGQHLKELRTRLIIVAAFFILGACLAYNFQSQVVNAVLAPLKGEKLVYLNPAGGFSFIFMISIYAGLALALPVLIQQLYAFIRPALPGNAQKKSILLIVGGFLLLIAGIAFGYFVAVPNALLFLYSFADQYINASLTADSYLNFIIAYTLGIGMVFQIPLLLILINSIKPLSPGGLMKSEKWVILISFIVAAIITPTPDPINQTIIAGPVIIVYQIGVVIIMYTYYKKRRIERRLNKKALARERRNAKRGIVSTPTPKPEVHTAPTPMPVPQPVARPVFQPVVTPIPQPKPVQTMQPTRPRSMDGFIRPTHPPIVVPKRAEPQPVPRALPRPISPNRRNFSIDGIYRPLRPQTN
jgi:sec-independent protein translocase protein TatC